ncbi:hypothetical protein [Streptomyces sp. NPDC050504]|uniref:hypothetical protein n=1 Tax=Streptomyces sp. NPDC050504 TaxID=3365618 RepID=UPI0037B2B741
MSRTVRRAAAALLSLLPLAACGIQESDVVEAGGAATVIVRPIDGTNIVLFFVGPNGRLMLVSRDLGFRARVDADGVGTGTGSPFGTGYRLAGSKVLATLLEGPTGKERASGLVTELGALKGVEVYSHLRRDTDGTARVDLRVGTKVHGIRPLALEQLVCTAAYAEGGDDFVPPVVVSGPDGSLPEARCELG